MKLDNREIIAEILGPSGEVHYRRPLNHDMVRKALSTVGYSVRLAFYPDKPQTRSIEDYETLVRHQREEIGKLRARLPHAQTEAPARPIPNP